MKQFMSFLVAILFATIGFSQTTLNLPWTDGFESGLNNWTQIQVSGAKSWSQSAELPYAGTSCAKFGGASGGGKTKLVSPIFDLSGTTNPTLTFYYKNPDWGVDQNVLNIYYRTDTSSSTWTLISTYSTSVTTWTKVKLPLNETNSTYQIAFEGIDNYGHSIVLDEVLLQDITCAEPALLLASNPTTTGLDLGWTDATGSNWEIQYMLADSTNWTTANSITTQQNPYTFTTLLAGTRYKFRVKSICSLADESDWSNVVSARTACESISTLPYTENFDTYVLGDTIANCWSRLQPAANFPRIVNFNSSSSPNSLGFQAGVSKPSYAITPAFAAELNTLRVKFMAQAEDTINSGVLQVGVMSDPTDTTTFELVKTIVPTVQAAHSAYEVSFADIALTGSGNYIVFRHKTKLANFFYWLDNIEVSEIPSCVKPSNIIASNATTSSIDLSWTNGHEGDASWWIYFKTINDSVWDSVQATSNPFVFTGNSVLLASTAYNIKMKTDCSGSLSEISDAITATTACGDAISTFPWFEGFEGDWYAPTNTSFIPAPLCWLNINKGTTQYKNSENAPITTVSTYKWTRSATQSNAHTGNGSAQMYTDYAIGSNHNDWLITPQLALSNNQRLRFWAQRSNNTSTEPEEISVWISDEDVTIDISAMDSNGVVPGFTQIFQQDIPLGNYQRYTINLSEYSGNRYIAFVRRNLPTNGYNLRLDDVTVENLPSCAGPTNPVATNITQTQAELSWTPGHETDASWNVIYRQIGNNVDTSWMQVTATSNPYILPNLTVASTYQFYVQTVCGTDVSEEVSPLFTFTTKCEAISIFPWTEGFENTWTPAPTGYASAPTCWININKGTENLYYWKQKQNSTSHGGIYCAAMYTDGSTSNNDWLITPEFNLLGNQRVTFWARNNNNVTNEQDEISVWISNENVNINIDSISTIGPLAGFTQLFQQLIPIGNWQQYEVPLSGYSGNRRIAFVRRNAPADGWNLLIDDIEVSNLPPCSKPINIAATNITTTSANITFTPGNTTDASWWFYFKAASDSVWDSTHISSTTHPLSNLLPGTLYNCYLATDCLDSLSAPTVVYTFSTKCAAISVFPWTEGFKILG